MKKIIAVAAFAAFTGLAGAQSPTQLYNSEETRILQQMAAGSLSVQEAMHEIVAAGRAYFPDDLLLNARNESYVRYALQLDRGEITFDRFLELVEQRKLRFERALTDRKRAEQAQRQAALEEAHAQAERERSTNAIGHFLQGIGNSLQRAYPPQINCNSYALGTQTMTTCR